MRKKTMLALTVLTGSVGAALATRTLSMDSTLALLSEGYTFIPKRCQRYRTDIFETRLMLTKAVCMMGQEAAEVFYEPGRFTRKGALPQTALRLLQNQGSAQVMDGEAHRWRKQMFMSLITSAGIQHLADMMAHEWRVRMKRCYDRLAPLLFSSRMAQSGNKGAEADRRGDGVADREDPLYGAA